MASSKTTTDRDTIRQWTEQHDGVPARIANANPDVLRIHFPDASDDDDSFEQIEWDEWFAVFEERKLAFLYSTDDESTFNKLVSRD